MSRINTFIASRGFALFWLLVAVVGSLLFGGWPWGFATGVWLINVLDAQRRYLEAKVASLQRPYDDLAHQMIEHPDEWVDMGGGWSARLTVSYDGDKSEADT